MRQVPKKKQPPPLPSQSILHCLLLQSLRPVALLSSLLHCLHKEIRPVALFSRLLRCLLLVTVLNTSQRVSTSILIGRNTATHCNTSASGVKRAERRHLYLTTGVSTTWVTIVRSCRSNRTHSQRGLPTNGVGTAYWRNSLTIRSLGLWKASTAPLASLDAWCAKVHTSTKGGAQQQIGRQAA